MKFLRRFFRKTPTAKNVMTWPNHSTWCALRNEVTIETEDGPRYVWTISCGKLTVPSGRLVASDPFACLQPRDNPYISVPKGSFPVVVTLADVSASQDKSHIREAYASIVFFSGDEAYRKAIPLAKDGEDRPELEGDHFIGFSVDTGTACFVDDSVVGPCMPDPETWYEGLFENSKPDCWFQQMDNPELIRAGIANIALPLAKSGENLVLFHSGWGDGLFPVIGSFDSAGRLLAAHIDFFVLK